MKKKSFWKLPETQDILKVFFCLNYFFPHLKKKNINSRFDFGNILQNQWYKKSGLSAKH